MCNIGSVRKDGVEPLGCGWLLFIGCSVVCFGYLCVLGDKSLLLFWKYETNYGDKFNCFMLFVFSMIDAPRLKLSILYRMERSIFSAVYA